MAVNWIITHQGRNEEGRSSGLSSNDPALRVKNKVAIALTIDELVTSQELGRGGYPKRVAQRLHRHNSAEVENLFNSI